MTFAAVAIGRNEGDRLKACLASLCDAELIVYVDSASTDGSASAAHVLGADVVGLDVSIPFTAARARNAGFQRVLDLDPSVRYVQFVDGDCGLVGSWPSEAIAFLDDNPDVAAVAGRRRERFPQASIYNWLCDLEWSTPIGDAKSFGGDVMIRVDALKAVGGYREDMIAGEEPELSVRLRAGGWRIWRLDRDMTLHDAAMTQFVQWWRRSLRGGYAYALGASIHGGQPECHKVRESRRAWIWGVWIPLACVVACLSFGRAGLALCLVYPLQILRLFLLRRGSVADRFKLALFQMLSRFPEAVGQLLFTRDRVFQHRRNLIEYK